MPAGKRYVLRIAFCDAWVIDAQLKHFLINERGYTKVNEGDYYVHCVDDTYQVIAKQRFERMYREVADAE